MNEFNAVLNPCTQTLYSLGNKSSELSQYLSVFVKHFILQDHLPADLGAVVHDDVHVGPGAKLSLPVGDGGERRNDQEGPANPHIENLKEECDGLNCFS